MREKSAGVCLQTAVPSLRLRNLSGLLLFLIETNNLIVSTTIVAAVLAFVVIYLCFFARWNFSAI